MYIRTSTKAVHSKFYTSLSIYHKHAYNLKHYTTDSAKGMIDWEEFNIL